ncbi:MAG: caspase family protein [Elusimicrobia bacterium]|nr:caspase family protein [Elusimicrobiota bacterium]
MTLESSWKTATRGCLTALTASAFLSGCAGGMSMPSRQDPFSGLGLPQAQAGYPDLSIALVASVNTKATVDLGHRNLAGKMTDDWLKQDFEFFQRHFGKVVHAGSIPEAWAAGVDLVAVYDVYEQSGMSCKYDETVVFLLPNGAELDRVRGATDTSMLFGGTDWLRKCVGDVQSQLAAGITGSKKLREFAQNKTVGIPIVVQKPSAPILPDILRPSMTAKSDESAFAIVVGIERYARIPQADFAERDAQSMTEHLLAMGVPRRNIIHLAGQEASYSSLKKYLESWLPKNVQSGSRVFFYFSGHGAPDVGTGEAYLLPWDGDPAFLKDTAYPTKRLYEQLAGLPAKEVVVATDACFSGAGGRSVLAKGARPLVLKVDTDPITAGNITIFAASASDQITSTLEDKGHGMFTYYFLKGLGGEARDASGRVTAQGLQDYLKPKVQDAARRQNRDQDPALHGPGSRELVRF